MAPFISTNPIRKRLLIPILLAAITIDTVLSNLTDLLIPGVPVNIRLVIFSVIGALAIFTGIVISISETQRTSESGFGGSLIVNASKAMRTIQFILVGIIAAILVEEIISLQYHTVLVISGITISYYTAGILLAILSYKFIQWFREKVRSRMNKVFLFFLLSSAMLSMILTMTIVAQSILLYQSFPDTITSDSLPQFPSLEGISSDLILILLAVPYLITPPWIFFTWIGSAVMLKSYIGSIGKPLFWALILGSLTTIILGSVIVYAPNTSGPFDKTLLMFRMIGISAIIIQGFLIALAFLKVSQNIREKVPIQMIQSLRTSAIGISLLFASVSANLAFGSFPPLGFISYSFVGLGAYLFVTGVYASAVSVSTYAELREMIHRFILDRSGFIDSIGSANFDLELRKAVFSISKDYVESIKDNRGFDLQISDNEYHQYLDKAIQEVLKAKKEVKDDDESI